MRTAPECARSVNAGNSPESGFVGVEQRDRAVVGGTASNRPSGLNRTFAPHRARSAAPTSVLAARTGHRCPSPHRAVAAAGARRCPSGLNETDAMYWSGPVSSCPICTGTEPSARSHSRTERSSLAVARVRPSAENATPYTGPVWPVRLREMGVVSVATSGRTRRRCGSHPPRGQRQLRRRGGVALPQCVGEGDHLLELRGAPLVLGARLRGQRHRAHRDRDDGRQRQRGHDGAFAPRLPPHLPTDASRKSAAAGVSDAATASTALSPVGVP